MSDKRLPVVGSTAATTVFCSARLEGPNGTHLHVDGNGKITRDNGTLLAPRPNAFSLRAQAVTDAALGDKLDDAPPQDCPGSTPACRAACYVGPLEKNQRAIYDLYEHNSDEIRRILASDELGSEWVMIMARWIRENAAGGFRWHVSGDVFGPDYALWIADVCAESPEVPHWIYTRSFGDEYLEPLMSVSMCCGGNLAVNLSCDRDNYERAQEVADGYTHWVQSADGGPVVRHPGPRLCYLTLDGAVPADLPEDSVIFPDYNIRPRQFATLAESPWWDTLAPAQRKMVCPVDAHGKAENRRCGPCDRCLT